MIIMKNIIQKMLVMLALLALLPMVRAIKVVGPSITSIVNQSDGTFTVNCQGAPGAQYYLESAADFTGNWAAVIGSTNTASSLDGTWSCIVSNPPPAYYRAVVLNP